MVVTSFDPEVDGLLSIPYLPKSIVIISKLILAATIVNEHVAVGIQAFIGVDDDRGRGALESMRRLVTSRLIEELLWDDLACLHVDWGLAIDLG